MFRSCEPLLASGISRCTCKSCSWMVFLLLRMDGEGRGMVYACQIKVFAVCNWYQFGKQRERWHSEVFEGQCSKCTWFESTFASLVLWSDLAAELLPLLVHLTRCLSRMAVDVFWDFSRVTSRGPFLEVQNFLPVFTIDSLVWPVAMTAKLMFSQFSYLIFNSFASLYVCSNMTSMTQEFIKCLFPIPWPGLLPLHKGFISISLGQPEELNTELFFRCFPRRGRMVKFWGVPKNIPSNVCRASWFEAQALICKEVSIENWISDINLPRRVPFQGPGSWRWIFRNSSMCTVWPSRYRCIKRQAATDKYTITIQVRFLQRAIGKLRRTLARK